MAAALSASSTSSKNSFSRSTASCSEAASEAAKALAVIARCSAQDEVGDHQVEREAKTRMKETDADNLKIYGGDIH